MYNELLARLKTFGQEHLLKYWHELDERGRHRLARQIDEIDLNLVHQLTSAGQAHEEWADLANRAEGPPAIRLEDRADARRASAARQRGLEALQAGQVGVIIVAGGQGTRLGFPHPKGMYPIGPISRATLFEILLTKVLARSRAANVSVPLYLMTSPATHEETVGYLADKRYFGLPQQDVTIFCQGTMPAVDAQTGKLLMSERDSLFLGPDGHGGMLSAWEHSGGLAAARRRGIRYLFYTQVDNPIVSIGDPEFLGHHILEGAEVSTQVAAKRELRDKVGNVVSIDDRLQIIEYSDLNPLPDEVLTRRDASGTAVFWAGNLAVHVFDLDFLERMTTSATALPYHFAHKSVPHFDPRSAQSIEPETPNAIKFERFIFDLLPAADRALVYEVEWRKAFAPVKNAPGDPTDSPETVQAQMIAMAREWLLQAGAKVSPDIAVEISPLLAQDAEELSHRIPPGLVVDQPRYFC